MLVDDFMYISSLCKLFVSMHGTLTCLILDMRVFVLATGDTMIWARSEMHA